MTVGEDEGGVGMDERVVDVSEGVEDSAEDRFRAARGMTYADGDVNSLNGSLADHARTRDARRRPFTEAEVAAWRKRIFAETMDDPVKVAVEEAVKLFGSSDDFTIWVWYANRIGVNNFLELYFEQRSVMRYSTLRNPAAAFHMRLKRFYNVRFPKAEGGAA